MPKQKVNKTSPIHLENLLSEDLLGTIPIFLSHFEVIAHKTTEEAPIYYRRSIEVSKFQTKEYESRGYHKAISKIV